MTVKDNETAFLETHAVILSPFPGHTSWTEQLYSKWQESPLGLRGPETRNAPQKASVGWRAGGWLDLGKWCVLRDLTSSLTYWWALPALLGGDGEKEAEPSEREQVTGPGLALCLVPSSFLSVFHILSASWLPWGEQLCTTIFFLHDNFASTWTQKE